MSTDTSDGPLVRATMQDVVDRLLANSELSEIRKRDLRSAIAVYGKIVGQPLAAILLDLGLIRDKLDELVPAAAKVSAKRWVNLRSDLAAAIAASGFIDMLKTADVERSAAWVALLEKKPAAIANGLSRLARWATLRGVEPREVNDTVIARFFTELEERSLVRQLRDLRRSVAINWNKLAGGANGLQIVQTPSYRPASKRIPWESLPATFRKEVEAYIEWCRVPDPLDDEARARALAPETLLLRRAHIHLAATAAVGSGIAVKRITTLARLVEPGTYKQLLRQCWDQAGGRFTEQTRDMAITLMMMAGEWVGVSAKVMVQLKELRSKLGGTAQRGFTEKNRTLLRRFEDPGLLAQLVRLPDKLWRAALRNTGKMSFVDLQTSLAIDILLHVPLRIKNLSQLRFDENIHWPQGRGHPAILVCSPDETKNREPLEYELPTALANRLYAFRNEIAPKVLGRVPDSLFVSRDGVPRVLKTVRLSIEKAVLRHVGIEMSPHQFRHLSGKIALDDNPGAYEHVSQLLGHRDRKTAPRFYTGINTRRAGRAHAALIARIRSDGLSPPRRDR